MSRHLHRPRACSLANANAIIERAFDYVFA